MTVYMYSFDNSCHQIIVIMYNLQIIGLPTVFLRNPQSHETRLMISFISP